MDKTPTPLLILILLGLLLIIAFSSGTEVAMLSVNRYRVRHRASLGQRPRTTARAAAQPARSLARSQSRDSRARERRRDHGREHCWRAAPVIRSPCR